MAVTAPEGQSPLPAARPEVEWLRRREEDVVHAVPTTGPAFTRSLCRRLLFTAGVQEGGPDSIRCSECELLLDGAPGEITEAYGS